MSLQISAPNVHLFAFHLHEDVPEDEKNWLWQSGNEIINKTLQQDLQLIQRLDLTKTTHKRRASLLKQENITDNNVALNIRSEATYQNQKIPIHGRVYPVQLFDSYGLWLNLSSPSNVASEFLHQLNPNNCFLLNGGEDFLGQTLILTAKIPGNNGNKLPEYLRNIADKCLESFLGSKANIPPFYQASTLFNSPIFEYGLITQQSDNYRHILVWLFTSDETEKQFNKCRQEFIDLLFFRSKIVKSYQISRLVYDATNHVNNQIKHEINQVNQSGNGNRLTTAELLTYKQNLKQLAQTSLEFAENLQYLEAYNNTIAIHANNYHDRLQIIKSIIPQSDIECLEKFNQEYSPFFQNQIKAELGYFNHGSGLLDKAIATIRTRIAIDQTELEREIQDKLKQKEEEEKAKANQLQITILAIGSGIGAGSILASSYPLITKENPINQPFSSLSPHPFVRSIFWSLVFGAFVGVVIWGIPRLWKKFKSRQNNS